MTGIDAFLQQYGVPAVFMLILLEYACFPVSSEIILPLAGTLLAATGMSYPVLVVTSTLAGLTGCMIPYVIGLAGGSPALEWIMKRWTSMEKPILTSYRVFGNHGKMAVFIGRLIPLCRTYIGFVAGAMKQPARHYIICSVLGIFLWNAILTGIGYYFYRYRDVYLTYIDRCKHVILVLGLCILSVIAIRALIKHLRSSG